MNVYVCFLCLFVCQRITPRGPRWKQHLVLMLAKLAGIDNYNGSKGGTQLKKVCHYDMKSVLLLHAFVFKTNHLIIMTLLLHSYYIHFRSKQSSMLL